MLGSPDAKHTLFRTRTFFISTSPAQSYVEPSSVERLPQRDGFHDSRVFVAAVRKRSDIGAVRVRVNSQIECKTVSRLVSKPNHVGELPRCVNVQNRHPHSRRGECFRGEMQKNSGIFPDAVQNDRARKRPHRLTYRPDCLGLECV
jgi:hypothetical protein